MFPQAGYVEVYNGEVRDLLRKPGEGAQKLPIRGSSNGGGGEVDNINVLIRGPDELGDIIRRGNEIRSTFSTSLNPCPPLSSLPTSGYWPFRLRIR